MWTLETGIELARKLEPIATTYGFHIALGGSVLTKGRSDKDLDLFIYVHNSSQPFSMDNFIAAIRENGFSGFTNRDHADYGDKKIVIACQIEGKRVDLFFL